MSKSVKMADIAKQLNISIVSVSKALSGVTGVSDETRKKVLDLANELGYARPKEKISENYKKTIVVIVAEKFFGDSSFYSNMYNSLLQGLSAKGYTTLLEIISSNNEKKALVPNILLTKSVSAIIYMGEINRVLINEIAKKDIPYFFLDFYDSNYNVISIVSDSCTGSYLLTKNLIDKGLTDITFVGRIDSTSSIMDRYLGYYKAMVLAGLQANVRIIDDRDENGKFIEVQLPEKLPQALVCNCDEVAFRIVQRLRDRQISIPKEISIIGFDGSAISEISTPSITTYKVDIQAMTKIAVSTANRLANDKVVTAQRCVVAGNFIKRDSSI